MYDKKRVLVNSLKLQTDGVVVLILVVEFTLLDIGIIYTGLTSETNLIF